VNTKIDGSISIVMNIYIFNQTKILYQEASKRIISRVRQEPGMILGLATGQSPMGVYQEMIHDHLSNHTSYAQVLTFNLDEYVGVPQTHDQSYFHFMNRELFKPLSIPIQHTHIPSGIATSLEDECIRYNRLLDSHIIDIQILGIGSNGHIGFNEPGTPFDSKTHVITLDQKTRKDNSRFFATLDEVPTQAITMGIHHILKAKEIILIAVGHRKSDAVYQMIKGPITPDCPASILQNHPNVHVYLDSVAAQKLTTS
jgi:glucosamine-6-phosphate deaminase